MQKPNRILLCLPIIFAALSGCETMPGTQTKTTPAAAPTDNRMCAKNFVKEGSALSLSGTTYKTFATISGVSRKVAMDRASKQIANDGLTITTLDRDGGLIMASNKVIAGKGDTVPLVLTFEPAKAGLQINMKFANGFGQVSPEDTVRDNFCNIIAAIEKK